MENRIQITGMTGFILIWLGQMASIMGTSMTGFATIIWAWKTTGQVTPLALVGVFNFGTMMILSPFSGAIVDRHNRKRIMIIGDLSAGLATICIFLLYTNGMLQIWHIYITSVVAGAAQAFHLSAYIASISLIVPKTQIDRASGMISMLEPASRIFAPILAGALVGIIGFAGILAIDIATFIVAIAGLFLVHIPQPKTSTPDGEKKSSLLKETVFGFKYLYNSPSLLGIISIIFICNLLTSFAMVVQSPMILARTGDNTTLMATVMSIEAIGGFSGGLLYSLLGGIKRRVNGMLMGIIFGNLIGMVVMGLGLKPLFWFVAAFAFGFYVPISVSCFRAILIAKIPPAMQGRVLGATRFISGITLPLSMLLGAPLADKVFEPAMAGDGTFSRLFGSFVGTGPGAGMALMYVIFGILCALIGVAGFFIPAIRNAEDILIDHDLLENKSNTMIPIET